MPNAEPAVFDAFAGALEQDPCGFGRDVAAAVAANIAGAPTVTVPVLLVHGDREPLSSLADVEAQRARYAIDNDDVSVLVVPDAGHMSMLERPAPATRAGMSNWLRARGF
jgi:pimeloyl-ACP methyl ester carboxylesterase